LLLAFFVLLAALGVHLSRGLGRTDRLTEKPPSIRIDINRAPLEVLVALPGIGPSRARAIIAEREKRLFASLDEVAARVSGMGRVTLANIEKYVTVGLESAPHGGAPVAQNRATETASRP
jgi:competence protein ComEA